MAWLMSLHVVSLIVWCAGLFYLPGLFVAYVDAGDTRSRQSVGLVSRFIFIAVTSPAGVLAIITGSVLVYATDPQGWWLPAKLLVVTLMVFFHLYCGRRLDQLDSGRAREYRGIYFALMAIPTVLIFLTLWLVLAKPDLSGFLVVRFGGPQ